MAMENQHTGIFHSQTKKMLKPFIKKFGVKKYPKASEIKKNYFLLSKQIKEFQENIDEKPVYAGIFLGKEQETFIPSLYLLNWLKEKTDQKIIVNDKAAWLFVCRRDILKESVIKENARKDQFVLVLNQQNECLGIGKFLQQRIYVKNLFDIGDFLRREKS